MIAIRKTSAVMMNPLLLTTQESALSHLQALVTALLSSSLELAPHQAEPDNQLHLGGGSRIRSRAISKVR